MAREEKTIEIDGLNCRFKRFNPIQSMRLAASIGGVFGASVGKLLKGGVSGLADFDMDSIDFADVIDKLFDKLTPEKFESLTYQILKNTSIPAPTRNGVKYITPDNEVNFNLIFSQESTTSFTPFKVLAEALKTEYGDFLDAFGESLPEPIQETLSNTTPEK